MSPEGSATPGDRTIVRRRTRKQTPLLTLPDGRSGEPVLTIRQPWASASFSAGKDVENRRWTTAYRGRLWINAGLAKDRREPDRWGRRRRLWLPEEPLPRGVIIGSVELVEILQNADSAWALPDHYHWLFARPRLLVRPIPWSGSLSLKWIRPPQGKAIAARRSSKSY